MEEFWKPSRIAREFDVSDAGRVRTRDREVTCRGGKTRTVKGRVLKNHRLKSTGYLQVVGSNRKKHFVHRLVAAEFVRGYRTGLVVNHKNGIRDDNRLENLEWVTQAENNKHAFDVLNRAPTCKGRFSADHPTSKAVIATCLTTGKRREFACALDAIRAGIAKDSGAISRCCNGTWAMHNGHRFEFANGSAAREK